MKPSALIMLGLNCLRECENDKRYIIDMWHWHRPILKKCHVCLVGCIIARIELAQPNIDLYPCDFPDQTEQFMTLDTIRRGNLILALSRMNIKHNLSNYGVTPYSLGKDKFKRDLLSIIERLKENDL